MQCGRHRRFFLIMDLVDAVAVDMLQIKGIVYSEVSAYLIGDFRFLRNHPLRTSPFRRFSFAMEALPDHPDDSVLFKNGHVHSVSCKESPPEKSPPMPPLLLCSLSYPSYSEGYSLVKIFLISEVVVPDGMNGKCRLEGECTVGVSEAIRKSSASSI